MNATHKGKTMKIYASKKLATSAASRLAKSLDVKCKIRHDSDHSEYGVVEVYVVYTIWDEDDFPNELSLKHFWYIKG
jgi:hypothetical protein